MSNEVAVSFGASGGFGAFTGWKMQSSRAATKKDREAPLDEIGNEAVSVTFNEQTDTSAEYKCFANTNTVPASIGKLFNGVDLTSISINTVRNAAATMSLQGHQHTAAAHADTLQQATHGISVPAWFGATDFLGGTGGTGAAVESGNVTISCQHTDEMDATGSHLVGNNYDAKITATTVWVGPVTTAAVAGWDVTVTELPRTNTGFLRTQITGVKAVTLATPS